MKKVEHSHDRNRFTEAELRQAAKESRTFWNSPEGRRAKQEQERRARTRQTRGSKFPSLAVKSGTKPELDDLDIKMAFTFGR